MTNAPFEPGDKATTLFEELLNWHQDEILSDSESHDLATRLLAIIDRYRPNPGPSPVVAALAKETAHWHIFWATIKDAIYDKADGFTCSEANAITEHAQWLGETLYATAFATSHALGDEEGDEHA